MTIAVVVRIVAKSDGTVECKKAILSARKTPKMIKDLTLDNHVGPEITLYKSSIPKSLMSVPQIEFNSVNGFYVWAIDVVEEECDIDRKISSLADLVSDKFSVELSRRLDIVNKWVESVTQ